MSSNIFKENYINQSNLSSKNKPLYDQEDHQKTSNINLIHPAPKPVINKLQRHSISHYDRSIFKDNKNKLQLNTQRIRRNSFLSRTMVSQESHIVYNLNGYSNSWSSGFTNGGGRRYLPTFVLALKESQGYAWNQDLFASRYIQETGVIFDSDDYYDSSETGVSIDDDVFDADANEDSDEVEDDEDVSMEHPSMDSRRRRRRSSLAYSYSQSHEEIRPSGKVKVLNIILTDEEVKKDPVGS